jgi:hypothetical protein
MYQVSEIYVTQLWIVIIIIIIIMLQPLPECDGDISIDEAVEHVTVERSYPHIYFK